mmetsp:Transcript_118716/g.217505  ORF Transcript_118716/g.217505 Transcript_118716/m.217505 type:complete len:142 (+) Transcript_118716:3-428(+)
MTGHNVFFRLAFTYDIQGIAQERIERTNLGPVKAYPNRPTGSSISTAPISTDDKLSIPCAPCTLLCMTLANRDANPPEHFQPVWPGPVFKNTLSNPGILPTSGVSSAEKGRRPATARQLRICFSMAGKSRTASCTTASFLL